ncbi:regulator of sigma subunit [Chlamydia sp. 17-3921]|uniref:regulator of sigma subunit n=1 Tax=Chlamydia sp. 17-3921 TaxID=2675798 RepID=UPI0019196FE7|nr:regulator of sigma subunit [Chlamydia sp. 17-3921]
MKQTFTKRILLFLFLVIPIPLILNLVFVSYFSFSAAKANLVQTLHTHATNLSIEFDKRLNIHKLFIDRLANTLSLKAYASPEGFSLASNEIFSLPDAEFSLCLINLLDGSIKAKHPGDPFIRYLKEHPELKKKLSNNIGRAILLTVPEPQPQHYLVLTEDIAEWNSPQISGLLIGFYPMSFLQKDLFQSLHITKGNICLLNKYGETLFCSQPDEKFSIFSLNLPNLPQLTPRTSPSIIIKPPPSILKEKDIVSVNIEGKNYLGLLLNKIPIQGIYTLSLVPVSDLIRSSLTLPINILIFYILAFCLMGWIFSKINKRLNQPLQELTLCMESAWQGNHNVRFEPQPYGYEINELGNIFNCTLLLLLNSIEKADIGYASGNKLQKELAILESLQEILLSPKFPSFPEISFSSQHLQGRQRSGHFYGWNIREEDHSLLGVIGLAGDIGLPSYLYALSARSLFLAYANLYSSIEDISKETMKNFLKTTEGNEATVSMTFLLYFKEKRELSLLSIGDSAPTVFLKRGDTFTRLAMPSKCSMLSNDLIVCVTGNRELSDHLSKLPIEALLKDSLSTVNGENFIDSLTTILNNRDQTEADGTLTILEFLY